MKSIIFNFFIIISLFIANTMDIDAQQLLSKLNTGQRTKELTRIAYSVLNSGDNVYYKDKVSAPEIYNILGYEVTNASDIEVLQPGDAFYKAKLGSIYYKVTFPIKDKEKYHFEELFAAEIYIWDNGVPFQIHHGGSRIVENLMVKRKK